MRTDRYLEAHAAVEGMDHEDPRYQPLQNILIRVDPVYHRYSVMTHQDAVDIYTAIVQLIGAEDGID